MSGHAVEQVQKQNSAPVNSGILQRKTCSCGRPITADGECAECRKKRMSLQRRAVNHSGPEVAPPIVHEVLRSPGRPLDPSTRSFMESRFNYDFGQVQTHSRTTIQPKLMINQPGDPHEQEADRVANEVLNSPKPGFSKRTSRNFSNIRIHTDSRAAESAKTVNALAYTVGNDLVFGAGQYAPSTSKGKYLLAHELTHAIQQSGGIASSFGPTINQVAPLSIQRTTVTVNEGCPGTEAEINAAVNDARTGIGRIAEAEARECLLEELNDADIVCEPGDVCGSTRYIGSTINIHRWGGGCPSLPALLVHESAHKCKLFFTEEFAEACENEAFGGRGATPPDSDESGGTCRLSWPEIDPGQAVPPPGACWVAREVIPDRWENARTYILHGAPSWFTKSYLSGGKHFANFISDKPLWKATLRPIFSEIAARGRQIDAKAQMNGVLTKDKTQHNVLSTTEPLNWKNQLTSLKDTIDDHIPRLASPSQRGDSRNRPIQSAG